VRTLIGVALGVVLFVFGIPILQSLVRFAGLYDGFGYQEAVLGLLLILAAVIVVQLTAPRSPPRNGRE